MHARASRGTGFPGGCSVCPHAVVVALWLWLLSFCLCFVSSQKSTSTYMLRILDSTTTSVSRIRIGRHHQMRRLAVLPPSPRFPPSACLALPRHLHSAVLRRLIDDSPFLLRLTTHPYCLRLAASLDASPGPSARIGNKDTTQYGFCTGFATVDSAARGSTQVGVPRVSEARCHRLCTPDSRHSRGSKPRAIIVSLCMSREDSSRITQCAGREHRVSHPRGTEKSFPAEEA
ncbi:hypothetical protein PYCCODRAFT_708439 [Trametes coccinea BRFM310]|uniref:Uncharacterized protein n=1 Tax=Trametes coccinea (strain BRFM310) TaxID=1353009 RepID=A0A1Y2IGG5_TRAC3|nr:hypothetical protein PYCCODRAFT_708439 [Trametes coccinea BRFM310]